jgi:hypothetical protein
LGVNDWSKVLHEFLAENCVRNTVGVPRFETPIRTKRMLDLYHEIVQQLESLKSGADFGGGASRWSGRGSCCTQIRASPKMHLPGVEKSSQPYRWNVDAKR